jgi:CNT family concentrative nucleoside transporter
MGVPWADSLVVGNLLGIKLAVTEFVAYGELGRHIAAGDISERAVIISTYALCGFANFASIGIQIGGLGALAPKRRDDLAKVGVRAMLGGALASWTTAAIAGILL